MYEIGQGVTQDYAKALMWFNLAAELTSEDQKKLYVTRRDSLATKMTSQQIAEAQRLAQAWKAKR